MKTMNVVKFGAFDNLPGYDLSGFESSNGRVGNIVGTDLGIVVSDRSAGIYVNFDDQWFVYTGVVDLGVIALKRCNAALATLGEIPVDDLDDDELIAAVEATGYWVKVVARDD